jgi:hypothetical protein
MTSVAHESVHSTVVLAMLADQGRKSCVIRLATG